MHNITLPPHVRIKSMTVTAADSARMFTFYFHQRASPASLSSWCRRLKHAAVSFVTPRDQIPRTELQSRIQASFFCTRLTFRVDPPLPPPNFVPRDRCCHRNISRVLLTQMV
jgi:hypothetical protein